MAEAEATVTSQVAAALMGGSTGTATSAREQVDIVDAAIRVAATTTGKPAAERRQALRGVQVGNTVTPDGASKTRVTREQHRAGVKEWARKLTPEQRLDLQLSEAFAKRTDRLILEEAFEELALEDAGASGSAEVDLAEIDLDAEPPDLDALDLDNDNDNDYDADEAY